MKNNKQSGLSLLVAMIVLVVISIAAIGLIRTVDTGILIAGNLAFRQSATHAADVGIEDARSWLLAPTSDLNSHNAARGYYAVSASPSNSYGLDLTGNKTPAIYYPANFNTPVAVTYTHQVAWPNTTVPTGISSVSPYCPTTTELTSKTGNTVCYVIHRMCNSLGAPTGSNCTTKSGTRGGSGIGGLRQASTYQQGAWTETTAYVYYRITVRVAGPRGNISFTQAFILGSV